MNSTYDEVYAKWRAVPEAFWAEAAEGIEWIKKWDRVLDETNKPLYQGYSGGIVNTCHNVLDRNVQGGRGDQPALIYDSPITDTIKTYTYRELLDVTVEPLTLPESLQLRAHSHPFSSGLDRPGALLSWGGCP